METKPGVSCGKGGIPFFESGIPRLVAFQKAALAGVPVFAVRDPRARLAWKDYERLGKEILP